MAAQAREYDAAVLDTALRRLVVLDFEIPNRFVNHGPMACEALDALGLGLEIHPWARSFAATVPSTARPVPALLDATFAWESALGDYRKLPQWIGYFEAAMRDEGWKETVSTWIPRLVPGLAAALFHGAIRTAHAVRAISHEDTAARRDELARALAHWSIWFQAGRDIDGIVEVDDINMALIEAAARGAHCYATDPNVFALHGVTGAMAIEILSEHLASDAGFVALAHLRAEHRSLYGETVEGAVEPGDRQWNEDIETLAARSFDPHQIKLVEACKRGFQVTGDDAFLSASEVVTDYPGP